MGVVIDMEVVRLARFERATFGSGDRRSSPSELQAHLAYLIRFRPEIQSIKRHSRKQKAEALWEQAMERRQMRSHGRASGLTQPQ